MLAATLKKSPYVATALDRLTTRQGVTLLCAVAMLLIMSTERIGRYLDLVLFIEPIAAIRAKAGLSAKADPRMRLVLFEDRAYRKLGRTPSFDDWQNVVELLSRAGFKHFVLLDPFDLDSSSKGDLPPEAQLIIGTVALPSTQNLRATRVEELERRLVQKAPIPSRWIKAPKAASLILAPSPAIRAKASKLGDIGIGEDNSVTNGIVTSDGAFIPHVSLATALAVDQARRIEHFPRPFDSSYYVDLVPIPDLLARAVPYTVFLTKDLDAPASSLSENATKILAGGEIAVLVPNAFTGSRFLDTPIGQVPAFVVAASMINNALKGEILYRPVAIAPALLACLLLALSFAWLGSMKQAAAALAVSLVLMIGSALVGYFFFGMLLPLVPCALSLTAVALARFAHHFIRKKAEHAGLARDLEMGRLVQSFFVSKHLEGRAGPWAYRILYEPYGAMSGDWVQVYVPPAPIAGVVGLLILGDVVGKGPGAALMTAYISSFWDAFCRDWSASGKVDVDRFMTSLNDAIISKFRNEQNTTVALAVLGEESIRVCVAGSDLWMRAALGRKCESVKAKRAAPLGTGEQFVYHEATVQLDPDEVLFNCTDGVLEGILGRRRLRDQVLATPAPDALAHRLLAIEYLADKVGKGTALADDRTLIMISRVVDGDALSPKQAAG